MPASLEQEGREGGRASEPHGQGARLPSLYPFSSLAGGRTVAYCSPAASRLHRATERETEEERDSLAVA